MGGASRREILSIKPETFFCAVFETSLNVPHSLVSRVKGDTMVEGCQGSQLISISARSGFAFACQHVSFARPRPRPVASKYIPQRPSVASGEAYHPAEVLTS